MGSYTASGTNHAEGDTDGGNRENVELAHALDMGVFCISPNDKGGMMYKPSKVRVLCVVWLLSGGGILRQMWLTLRQKLRIMQQRSSCSCRCFSFHITVKVSHDNLYGGISSAIPVHAWIETAVQRKLGANKSSLSYCLFRRIFRFTEGDFTVLFFFLWVICHVMV